ncbi:MAG: hypothetical protein KGI58_01735 [Patescibacteria group bacterium]|nr:hypothetical protein [Patescibacteria group bacterium]
MRKEKSLFIIGLWIILLPLSGFPSSWKTLFFFITGLLIIYISYLFYMQAKKNVPKDLNQSKTFIDNISNGE